MFSNDIKFTVIIVTLLILLLIAGVIITIFVSNRRHVQQEVKIIQIQADYEKELRTAEQEVQEQVLVNVARDLHDNIGQLLTVMNMQLEQQKILNSGLSPAILSIQDTLLATIHEVRRVGKSLNSDLLETNGLISTIQQEVIRLQQLNYKVTLAFDSEPNLSKDQKIIAFRIFQEMLNNILKHAGAKNININVAAHGGFRMAVTDDGRGFNVQEKLGPSGGSGLKNMIKRAEMAKMKCTIESTTDRGSTFVLQQLS
ncbi:MAG: ATP-binding protein [Bacteroidota bacterium]